ncbi:hypothetical protein KC640_00210 [Candidatus Dojkabacteria bacterium]|uniref:Uncharacterized protein n=1 Tax=Candidatus Dojkabacteria bacterium TaxID=2099670 RepID=A0A955KZA7_9BACT|nr:hypothetical protein [Candidatus Dojkabacteria bacterium]
MWKILSSKRTSRKLKAFSTLEVATAAAFLAILLAGSYSIFSLALNTVERARQYTLAEFYAHDLLEMTLAKRNEDWNSLAAGTYHFTEDLVTGLEFASGSETVDIFTRSVQLVNLNRDVNGNLNLFSGTPDPYTFMAVSTVTWSYRGQNYQVALQQMFTNWKRF